MIAAFGTIFAAGILAAFLVLPIAMALALCGLFPPFQIRALGRTFVFSPPASRHRSVSSTISYSSASSFQVGGSGNVSAAAAVIAFSIVMQSGTSNMKAARSMTSARIAAFTM
jgi:hypothetical protein